MKGLFCALSNIDCIVRYGFDAWVIFNQGGGPLLFMTAVKYVIYDVFAHPLLDLTVGSECQTPLKVKA